MSTAGVLATKAREIHWSFTVDELIEEVENQQYPEHYPPEVYRAADKAARPCTAFYDGPPKVKHDSVGDTNVLMKTLQAEFVGPLSQIPDLHSRVVAPVMDQDLIARVEAVFIRIQTLNPPVDDKQIRPSLQVAREEYWKRTYNILFSQFKPLLLDVCAFLQKRQGISAAEAAARICSRPKKSIADSIAVISIDRLFKRTPTGEPMLSPF